LNATLTLGALTGIGVLWCFEKKKKRKKKKKKESALQGAGAFGKEGTSSNHLGC